MLLVVIAVPVFLAVRLRPPSCYVTGDPLDIRLYGIAPGGTSDVLDVRGKKIGESCISWRYGLWQPNSNTVNRTYIFDLPKTEEVVFSPWVNATESGKPQSRISGFILEAANYTGYPNDKRLYWTLQHYEHPSGLLSRIPLLYRLFANRLTAIDVTLAYWTGPRGKAEATFVGPFVAGKPSAAENDDTEILVLRNYYSAGDGWGVQGQFRTPVVSDETKDVLTYDSAGKRGLVEADTEWWDADSSSDGSSGTCVAFDIPGRSIEDIAAITIGEEGKEKTFHRLPVRIRGITGQSRPPYLEAIAKRLQLAGDRLANLDNYSIHSDDEALKVIDLVQGSHAQSASWMVQSKLSSQEERAKLSAEDLERIRRAVDAWRRSDDAELREQGITLGISLSPREFIPIALAYCESGEGRPYAFERVSQALAEHTDEFSPDDIRRIEQILKEKPDNPLLWECLSESKLPEATGALGRLELSDNIAVWWRAMGQDNTLSAFGDKDSWPDEVKVRAYIASGPEASETESIKAEAEKRMISFLTDGLPTADPVIPDAIFERLAEVADRATVEPIAVSSLRLASRRGLPLLAPVRQLNAWYGFNIGGVGASATGEDQPIAGTNPIQAVRDAVHWLDTGEVRIDSSDGYRVTGDDLRVIAYRPESLEKSAIGIWTPSSAPDEFSRVHIARGQAVCAVYSIAPTTRMLVPLRHRMNKSRRPPPDYSAEYAISEYADDGQVLGSSYGSRSFSLTQLPYAIHNEPEHRVVVERADSPESVLSGTKLFDEWWKAHGPVAAAAAGIESSSSQ